MKSIKLTPTELHLINQYLQIWEARPDRNKEALERFFWMQGLDPTPQEKNNLGYFFDQTYESKQNGLQILMSQGPPMPPVAEEAFLRLAYRYSWDDRLDKNKCLRTKEIADTFLRLCVEKNYYPDELPLKSLFLRRIAEHFPQMDNKPNPLLIAAMERCFKDNIQVSVVIYAKSPHQIDAFFSYLETKETTLKYSIMKDLANSEIKSPKAQKFFSKFLHKLDLPDLLKALGPDTPKSLIELIMDKILLKIGNIGKHLDLLSIAAKCNSPDVVLAILNKPHLSRFLSKEDLVLIANQNRRYAVQIIIDEKLLAKLTDSQFQNLVIRYPEVRIIALNILDQKLSSGTIKTLFEQKDLDQGSAELLLKKFIYKVSPDTWINLFEKSPGLHTDILKALSEHPSKTKLELIQKLYGSDGSALLALCTKHPAFIQWVVPLPEGGQFSLTWRIQMELMYRKYQDSLVPEEKDQIRRADIEPLIKAANQFSNDLYKSNMATTTMLSLWHSLGRSKSTTETPDSEAKERYKHFLSPNKQVAVEFLYHHLQLDEKGRLTATGFWQVCAYIVTCFYNNKSKWDKILPDVDQAMTKDTRFATMQKILIPILTFWKHKHKEHPHFSDGKNPGLEIINLYRESIGEEAISLDIPPPPVAPDYREGSGSSYSSSSSSSFESASSSSSETIGADIPLEASLELPTSDPFTLPSAPPADPFVDPLPAPSAPHDGSRVNPVPASVPGGADYVPPTLSDKKEEMKSFSSTHLSMFTEVNHPPAWKLLFDGRGNLDGCRTLDSYQFLPKEKLLQMLQGNPGMNFANKFSLEDQGFLRTLKEGLPTHIRMRTTSSGIPRSFSSDNFNR